MKKKGISEELAIVCLILNILIMPGLGTLIGKKIKEGIWQLVLLIVVPLIGIALTIMFAVTNTMLLIISIPLIFAGVISAWIWGIVSGVQIIKESK
ncbi:hypothetical protein GF386_02350 [Candidatus Pacearchaeota archaeon]|nr:hypothetical protein [Candidatus Pacearchaeota archaeon]MBD3282998.1 hypothetical protein [Candidatus Pacearchaeota archaeon]